MSNSVNQLAAILPEDVDPDWSRYMACSLFEALVRRGKNPRTIATYLDGLIGLGLHGKVGDAKLAGLREMRAVAAVRAGRVDKKKVARIAHLTERGGFLTIAEAIGRLRSDAEGLPAWSAAAERLRRAAAILAVEINAFGRTGDVAAWRLGVDLVREPWGAWRLAWDQGKTSDGQDVGELWSEVGDIIDELLLGRLTATPRRTSLCRTGRPELADAFRAGFRIAAPERARQGGHRRAAPRPPDDDRRPAATGGPG